MEYELSQKYVRNQILNATLASSPAAFLGFPKGNIQHTRRIPKTDAIMTGHGLHIELLMVRLDSRNKMLLGIVEELLTDKHDIQTNRVGIAIVLKQRAGKNANIMRELRAARQSVYLSNNSHAISQHITSRLIYLQDNTATSFKPTVTDVGRSLRRYLLPRYLPPHPAKALRTILLSLYAIHGAEDFLSSLWPPTVHYQAFYTPGLPVEHSWLNF
jgi:hypothetical protein